MCKYGDPNTRIIANSNSYDIIWSPGRNYYFSGYGAYYKYKGAIPVREKIQDGFGFVPMFYPFNRKNAIQIVADSQPIGNYQEYIQNNHIEMAEIIMPDLEVLRLCPTLKYLVIYPSYDAQNNFDFTPLYEAEEICSLRCQNQYGSRNQYIAKIDYSKINGLLNMHVSVNEGTLNYNKVETLKSLTVGNFIGENRDLTDLFCSSELDTLRLTGCGMQSLNGIDTSINIQCLYLHYNRLLKNISALSKVKKTLKALRIENCPKIEDFSVLSELEKLELLELSGSNTIPDLSFLKSMKNLKTFTFNMNVLDGDLSPCLNLSYVYSERNRKHYNLKDSDLPKGEYVRGNETIELWRRLE